MTTTILKNPNKGSHCHIKANKKFFLYAYDGTLVQTGEFTDNEKAIAELIKKGWEFYGIKED